MTTIETTVARPIGGWESKVNLRDRCGECGEIVCGNVSRDKYGPLKDGFSWWHAATGMDACATIECVEEAAR